MFKYFHVLFVYIFLCSINVLSMNDNREKIELPLAGPQFKNRTILLQAASGNGFPIVFKQSKKPCFTHYIADDKPVGQLLQIGDIMRFESCTQKSHDFSLQNCVQAGLLAIATNGRFTFQKSVDASSVFLTCKTVNFFNTFFSNHGLTLEVDSCNNTSDVACESLYFKGQQLTCLSNSSLTASRLSDLLVKQGVLNDGAMSCGSDALINTPSLENLGTLSANNLRFVGGAFFNKGDVSIEDSFFGKCKSFDHHGSFDVRNDCVFEKVDKFFTALSSRWNVGGSWRAQVGTLLLKGDAAIGNLALFVANSHVSLCGYLRAFILNVYSNKFIKCNASAKLIAAYCVGLKSKGYIQFDGNALKRFLSEKELVNYRQKIGELCKVFSQGVFLCSEQGGVKASGKIIANNGIVYCGANKGLTHTGLIVTGFDSDAIIVMDGGSLKLAKESLLKGYNARLIAQISIDQLGMICVKEGLLIQSPEIVHHGFSEANNIHVVGNNCMVSSTSRLTCEGGLFDVQETIVNLGDVIGFKQFVMNAKDIFLEKTSHVFGHDMYLNARQDIINAGLIGGSIACSEYKDFVEDVNTIARMDGLVSEDCLALNNRQKQIKIEDLISLDDYVANFHDLSTGKMTGVNSSILIPKI